MTRLKAIHPDQASGKTKELFDTITSKYGIVSKMMSTMGNSPVLLEGFLAFHNALSEGALGPTIGELIALTVSESNGCNYCVAAHKYVGARFGKLDSETIEAALKGSSKEAKTDAILKFSLALVNEKGGVSDADVAAVKAAGVSDSEIGEIVGHVALNILSNYFNKLADTELDAFLKS